MKAQMKPAIAAIALIGLAACSGNKEQPRSSGLSNAKPQNCQFGSAARFTNQPQSRRPLSISAGSGAVRASDINRTARRAASR